MRCFIAVKVPEHIRSRILHESEILKSKNLFQGSFVKKDNLHMTLKFLGELTNEDVDRICEELEKVKHKRFEISLSDFGFFDKNKIRVIWVGIFDEESNLRKLHEKAHEATLEIPLDYNEFNSHITVARVRSVKNNEELVNSIKNLKLKKESFEINKFYLMKSELSREGSKYKTIKEFNLV